MWEESPDKAAVGTDKMVEPYPWRLMRCAKTKFLQKTCKPTPLDSDETGQTNGPGDNLAIHQDVLLYTTGRQLGGFNGDKLEYPSQAHVLNLKHPGTPRQLFTSHSRIFVGFTSKGVPLAFTNNNEVEWMYMEKHGNPTAWGFDPSKKWQAVKIFEGQALNGYITGAAVGDRIIWQDYIEFPGMKNYPVEAPSDVVRYVNLTGEKIKRTVGETVLGYGHFLGKIFVREQVTQADHQCRASAVDLRSNGAVEFTEPGDCQYPANSNAPGEAFANMRDWGSKALAGHGDDYFFLSTWVHDDNNPDSQTIHVYDVK